MTKNQKKRAWNWFKIPNKTGKQIHRQCGILGKQKCMRKQGNKLGNFNKIGEFLQQTH